MMAEKKMNHLTVVLLTYFNRPSPAPKLGKVEGGVCVANRLSLLKVRRHFRQAGMCSPKSAEAGVSGF